MTDQTTTEEIVGVDEAAAILRVHRNTILAQIHRGEIPAARVGQQWRIRRADINALFTTNEDAA